MSCLITSTSNHHRRVATNLLNAAMGGSATGDDMATSGDGARAENEGSLEATNDGSDRAVPDASSTCTHGHSKTVGVTTENKPPITIYVQTMINGTLAVPEGNIKMTFDDAPIILDIANKWKVDSEVLSNAKFCDVDFRLPEVYPYPEMDATGLVLTDTWEQKYGGDTEANRLTIRVSASKGS
jgi:hypothetical protein